MFRKAQRGAPAAKIASGAKGYRAYVVGDVHGRLDLLDDLLARIEKDLAERPARRTVLVFVGDLIDRGPNSAAVIERLRNYRRGGVRPVFLLGNHEEVMLRVLGGDAALLANWLRFGGAECLRSYGVDPEEISIMAPPDALRTIREAVPPEHSRFLHEFADTFRFGDYLIVHAGVRPGVPLAQQTQSDLRWIRAPFLEDSTAHGFVVVHGHTISEQVEERPNRIGIDTGAYASGVLTALAIDGDQRWFLDTRVPSGAASGYGG